MTIPIIGITCLMKKKRVIIRGIHHMLQGKNYSESIDLAGGLAIFLPNQRKKLNNILISLTD